MIIELYGLPGAGKTTIIKNITGGSATTVHGIGGIRGLIVHFAKRLVVYFPETLRYKHRMKKIMKRYCTNSTYISTPLEKHFDSIAMVAFGYSHIKKNIYMDEGIIHRIITLAVNFTISDDDVFTLIDIFKPAMNKVKSYYLDLSVEECIRSIIQRNRHECEMDGFNIEKLLEFLEKYEHYCHAICSKYHHEIVSRDNYETMR